MTISELLALPIARRSKISRILRQIERERRRLMDAQLRDWGLQGDMYLFLLTIENSPGTSQDYLSEHLMLDKGNVARSAQKLEQMGLILREPVMGNRRQYAIYLSEAGQDILGEVFKALAVWEEKTLSGFSDVQEQQLLDLLSRMLEK